MIFHGIKFAAIYMKSKPINCCSKTKTSFFVFSQKIYMAIWYFGLSLYNGGFICAINNYFTGKIFYIYTIGHYKLYMIGFQSQNMKLVLNFEYLGLGLRSTF